MKRNFLILLLFLCGLAACYKRNFYEDANNPGLTRFTSRNYDIASAYINAEPWITGYYNDFRGPFPNYIMLNKSTASKDTLNIIWNGRYSNVAAFASKSWGNYWYVIVSIPVNKNFKGADFLNWNGKIFPADTIPVSIALSSSQQKVYGHYISGKGKIYFVKIASEKDNQDNTGFKFSGLFEGNIGDSVLITKGRFDYEVPSRYHNLQ